METARDQRVLTARRISGFVGNGSMLGFFAFLGITAFVPIPGWIAAAIGITLIALALAGSMVYLNYRNNHLTRPELVRRLQRTAIEGREAENVLRSLGEWKDG